MSEMMRKRRGRRREIVVSWSQNEHLPEANRERRDLFGRKEAPEV